MTGRARPAIFDRYATLIRFENQALLNLPIRKLVYQRRGAIAHATVRAPGVPADPGTIADLDDLLRRTGLDRHLAAGSLLAELALGLTAHRRLGAATVHARFGPSAACVPLAGGP